MYSLNICILGPYNVGKTTLLNKYFGEGSYDKRSIITGIDSRYNSYTFGDIEVNIKFINLLGIDKFINITKNMIKNANGIFIVFDISDRNFLKK